MYRRVLIANRGEIALRIIRTLREMGISAVAVYSDADRCSRHVLEADEAYRIGPPPASDSYLNADAIIATALEAKAEAIHPGYGFLAESPDFAEAVRSAGITFIGPSPTSMRLMGDKIAARRAAIDVSVPVVPGSGGSISSLKQALAFVHEHDMPVVVKAGGGGGGRGIRIVEEETDLEGALEAASREANTYFRNPQVYLERYFRHARHIEVQVVGDASGKVVAWGERDCSTQRRRQKLVEETPAPGITTHDRDALMDAAARLVSAAEYQGVGTVEFLYAGPGQFFFLEMNTRIQVEHTVTEEVTGLDLVRESIEVSCGRPATSEIHPRGHAIEARINAEDPGRGFAPGTGLIKTYREPGGNGVRVDSGVYQGFSVPAQYDSLMAKVVATAPDRDGAIARLVTALRGYCIEGVPSTISLTQRIVDSSTFREGDMTTDWLDAHLDEVRVPDQPQSQIESEDTDRRVMDVEVNGKRFAVAIYDDVATDRRRPGKERFRPRHEAAIGSADAITSPMHGTVLAIKKSVGDLVSQGEPVMVVEAMKMENEVRAPRDGKVAAILVGIGDTIEVGQRLTDLEPLSLADGKS